MKFFRRQKPQNEKTTDPFSHWQAPKSVPNNYPELKTKNFEMDDSLDKINPSYGKDDSRKFLIICLGIIGHKIIKEISERTNNRNAQWAENFSFFLIHDKNEKKRIENLHPFYSFEIGLNDLRKNDVQEVRKSYSEAFHKPEFSRRFNIVLERLFGNQPDLHVFLIGSLYDPRVSIVGSLVDKIKTHSDNSEINLLLSLSKPDSLILEEPGQMLARIREFKRLTVKSFHFFNGDDHISPISSLSTFQEEKNLIDQIYLFDGIAKDSNRYITGNIIEGLFFLLDKNVFNHYQEKRNNLLVHIREVEKEFGIRLFSTYTTKALIYPSSLIDKVLTLKAYLSFFSDSQSNYFGRGSANEEAVFWDRFIHHPKLFHELINWVIACDKKSDLQKLPEIDADVAIHSLKYVLVDVIQSCLTDPDIIANINSIRMGLEKISSHFKRVLTFGQRSRQDYDIIQTIRWEKIYKFTKTGLGFCSHLASDLFEWNENVSSFREKIRQDVDQALNDIKGKFDVNPSRKYSLNFDEIILFADNKVDLLIKEINHYCTWKFDHVNECFLFHVSGGKSFIHYDEIEDIAQHLKNLIFRLIDKRIDMGGEKITSLSNEDWKFFREIIHEDGLTFEKNHEQIHQIQYSSLDDIEWLFINNIPDGSLKQRDLLMNYSEKQIEIFHGSQQNVCSILKFNHMIPFNAIDFFNENQNAYRNSNHLFTQDWNAAWYEHQMKLEGIAKNFQSIVDSLTPCFWSPVLINAFFIALASEIVYLDDKDINLKKWLLKSLSDYKDIELYRDESRYELGKSLVETFKAFTLTIPCKHRFGNDIFNPFYNANILDFVKAIYEHAEEGDPQILRRFADDLETNESKEVVSFRNLLCYQERRYKEFSSNFDRVSLKGKNDPNPLMWKIR